MAEERRTVVILFARVDGLADLPEGDRALHADGVFSRLRDIIESRGGSLDKFIGDVVMALWGAPVAHEDDAARAAQAAIRMSDETNLYADETGLPFSLRAGLNLGEVLFGSVGGDRPTAMGDPVNVAQRLMAGAHPGSIVVSRAVANAAGSGFRTRPLASMVLKGRAEPVEALEVIPDEGSRTTLRAVPDLAAPIRGRSAETEALVARLGAAASGRAECAVLSGDPGIGKSRLAAEIRRRLRADPAAFRSYVGQMSPDVPYHGLEQVVREALGAGVSAPGMEDALGARVFESLGPEAPRERERRMLTGLVLGSLGLPAAMWGADSLDPARVVPETLRAWSLVLASLASRGPVVLVFEDIHAADEGSRRLFEQLPAALATRAVAVLATMRPDGMPPPGWFVHAMGGIGRADLSAVASRVLGAELASDLEEFLAARAEGNPLFAMELARYLRENNLAGGTPARLLVPPSRLPDRLTSLLTARLDGLPADARGMVKVAAVLGREFSAPMVSRVACRDASDPLHLAASRRIVSRLGTRNAAGEEEWSFQHALVRDAAYQLLTKRERKTLHQRAADDLEPRAAADPRRVGPTAARHREQAGQPGEAAALWGMAARAGLQQKAWLEAAASAGEAVRLGNREARTVASDALCYLGRLEEARAHIDAALADPATVGPRRSAVLRSLARMLNRAGKFEEARAAAAEAEPLDPSPASVRDALIWQAASLERLGHPAKALALLDRVPQGLAGEEGLWRERAGCLMSLGRYEEARGLLTAALASAEGAGDRWSTALALNSMGLVDLRGERPADAVPWFERAAEAFRDTADRAGRATSLSNLGIALGRIGRDVDAESAYRESLSIRRDVGDLAGVFSSLSNLAMSAATRGELQAALATAREALGMAERLGNYLLRANAHALTGNIEFRRGLLKVAGESYEAAQTLLSRVANPEANAKVLMNMGLVRLLLRNGSAALPPLKESLRVRTELGQGRSAAGVRELIALSHVLRGEIGPALDALAPTLAECPQGHPDHVSACGVILWALLAAGREGEAEEPANAVRRHFESGGNPEVRALLSLAVYERRRGDRGAARRIAGAALEGSRAPGGAASAIEASLLLAAMDMDDGSAESASGLAGQARAWAQAAGDRAGEALSLLTLAGAHARLGDMARARAAVEAGRELLPGDSADPFPRIEVRVALSRVAANLGDTSTADAAAADARRVAREAGLPGLLFDYGAGGRAADST